MRNILITGANSGIGLETVKQLSNGNNILAISRNINNIPNINSVIIKQCDVTNYQQINNIVEDFNNQFGEIDVLINNAGVAYYNLLENNKINEIQEMINVNILGFTNVLHSVIPLMIKNNAGTIINLSSLADRVARPNSAVYAATKAYVKSISDSLCKGLAKHNIRVSNLSPSNINTPLLQSIKKMNSGYIDVSKFVEVIKFIIKSDYSMNIRDIVIGPTGYEG